MDYGKFNGNRLRIARTINAMTITELAEKTGISKQSLSLYENGKNTPDYSKIITLSLILKFPSSFFFSESKLEAQTPTVYFRSQATATKTERTAEKTKLELVALMYELFNDYIEFPTFRDPKVEFNGGQTDYENTTDEVAEQIEQAADAVRAAWNLGDGPIDNLQLALEKNGIIVTGFSADSDKIDAFSQKIFVGKDEVCIIALALGQRSEARIRFDNAHELGHIVLHPWGEDIDAIDKEEFKSRETQANMFAGAFLLPRSTFGADVSAYPTDMRYYQYLKKKWGVSIKAMIVRAYQLKYLSYNQYQYLMRQYSKNGWRTKEPDDVIYNLDESLFQSAIDLLISEGIFTRQSLMREFENHGLAIHPEMIEELLHLKKGTLVAVSEKEPQIIQLRINTHNGE